MNWLLVVLALGSVPALAEDLTAAPQPDAGTSSLLDELDAAASAPPPGATGPALSTNPVVRAFQSLNPDLSVIVDATGGYAERVPLRLAGDDPDLKGDDTNAAAGFTLQELEVGFQAVVDPFFRADVFLTIPNLSGLEVEEARVTTTSLPFDLQLTAGIFRSALGRQNGQHLHAQRFTFRPLLNAAYLATDGLRSPGVQLSWLAPVPFFLQLNLEAFSVEPPDELSRPTTFGGGKRTDLTYTAELKTFAAASASLSFSGGLNFATGLSPGLDGYAELTGARSLLWGADLYVLFKPANEAAGYFTLAWTTEYFARKLGAFLDGGLYSQVVVQFARGWSLGLREDVLGLPASALQPLTSKTSLSLGFAATEFARLRAQVQREFAHSGLVTDAWGGFLTLEVSIGAHGAHAF